MHWSPEQWVTVLAGVISAITSAVVTIINAFQLKNHEANAQVRFAANQREMKEK